MYLTSKIIFSHYDKVDVFKFVVTCFTLETQRTSHFFQVETVVVGKMRRRTETPEGGGGKVWFGGVGWSTIPEEGRNASSGQ